VEDPETEVPCLWSVRGLSGKAEPLENFPPGSCCGTWSSDGNTFVFTAGSENKHDLWAEVERRPSFLGKQAPRPVRLTAGPLDYQSAVLDATRDGVIYAVGKSTEAKVLRFDRDSQKFEPYLGGLKGFELDYSRDGKWIAYISYPERALWKLRTDGSDRMQLTFPPINPIEPHWSPDGSRIAFMGQATGKPRRLFMIGADGGAPVEVTTYPSDQGVPTWHRDGKMIAFGDVRKGQPPLSMTIHVLDLSENRTSEIAGSNGLWSPRWSPDGRYIAATSEDSRKLLVFDRQNSAWRTLAVFASLDNLTWTRDGAYIYFRAATLRGERAPGLLDYAIYRIRTTGLELERLIALTGLHGTFPEWIGLAPDGSPLVAEDRFSEEIYSLKIVK
jgi:Tol biopolymer transport system component